DLGGTNLRGAVADTDTGQIFHQRQCPTLAAEGQESVIHRIVQLIKELTQASGVSANGIKGVGIGVPGTPDIDTGVIQILPNLPGQWLNVPLQAIVEEQVRLPVALINDVRAITLGEWMFGAGRGVETLICLAIGTGIGGGVVVNGQFHLGIGGTAGEFGHHVVEVDGLPCGCGGRGCLELYASGPAIAAMGVKEVLHGHTTRIGELVNYDLNRIDAEIIIRAAKDGDYIAKHILQRAGRYLGIAVGNILGTISPQRVIFGGGVSRAGELLLTPILQTVKERASVIPVEMMQFVLAELGMNGGLIGAALWARRRCEQVEEEQES
ncbi:MAG TPA: ROK family protein, partial [Anaerolineales bacterium]|nr:ROK family protein [Anaerolineales bacterium]